MYRIALMTLLALVGCSQAPEPTTSTPSASPVGGDVDAHGCRASAGYRWCEQSQQCERPWELAQAKGFPNSQEGFEQYCAAKPGQ